MFLLMLLNGVPAVAEVDGAGWLVAAEQSLKQALAQAYPQVAEWAIEPLIGKRQRANLPKTDALQARAAHLGKRSAVRLTWVESRHRASTTVWFAVRGLQSVPTATSDIRVGAALTPDMAEYAERDVFVSSCATLSTPAALTSTRAKKGLRMGEAICENAVEPRPPVGRGESVVVRSVAGAVTITSKAVAQQDGALGQMLRVKNPSSGEVYSAAVSGAGEVVVHD